MSFKDNEAAIREAEENEEAARIDVREARKKKEKKEKERKKEEQERKKALEEKDEEVKGAKRDLKAAIARRKAATQTKLAAQGLDPEPKVRNEKNNSLKQKKNLTKYVEPEMSGSFYNN